MRRFFWPSSDAACQRRSNGSIDQRAPKAAQVKTDLVEITLHHIAEHRPAIEPDLG
jgi:hypothetical protein